MCGRYTQTGETEKLLPRFEVQEIRIPVTPRYNIAPSQKVPVIVNDGGKRVLDALVWGLVPAWTKELKKAMKPVNAKSETVATSGMYKRLLTSRRCIVPADSFFEWIGEKGRKQPMRISVKGGEPFAFAGLWDSWKDPANENEELRTCVILTTAANDFVRKIHDRMPVILPKEAEETWLDPKEKDPEKLVALLKPFPAELMEAHPVNPRVNNAKNEGPECVEPLVEGETPPEGPVTPEQIGLFKK